MPLIRRKPTPETEPAAVSPTRLFTPKQAADLLQVSEFTLERWRRTGEGPPYVRLSARAIRYREGELAGFIEERVTRHTTQAVS